MGSLIPKVLLGGISGRDPSRGGGGLGRGEPDTSEWVFLWVRPLWACRSVALWGDTLGIWAFPGDLSGV